jgi:nitroreductase
MQVFEAVSTNIAVREFLDMSLNEEHLRQILEAGRLCQSGKNLQPWHFILIRDRELLNSLADLMSGDLDEPIVRKAPAAIAIVSDPTSEFHVLDAGRAAQNMTLTAWELGIGSCFMSGPEQPAREPYRRKAHELLGIPDRLNLVDLIVFGYPKRRIVVRRKKRKELQQLVSESEYGNPLVLG